MTSSRPYRKPRATRYTTREPSNLEVAASLSQGHVPVVLGVDASLVKPGFAVLDAKEQLVAWRRPDHTRLATEGRVVSIYQITQELVQTYTPELVIIETSAGIKFRGDGWRAGDALSFSRGIIWSAIVTSGIYPLPKVEELRPDQARCALLGWNRGSPDKEQIMQYLQWIGYTIPKDKRGNLLNDVADAMALCVYVQTLYKSTGGLIR